MANGRRSKSNLAATSSILPFLKPTEASTKTGQNETLPKPKVATAKSCSEPKIVENEALPKPKVAAAKSQTLIQNFFPKNA